MPGASTEHMGDDFGVPVGTPVSAAADGYVESAGPHGGFGNAVVVRHSDGYTTLYGHLSNTHVKPGDPVVAGNVLGASGATGTVTGPNLHFGTYRNGQPVAPSFGAPTANDLPDQGAIDQAFGVPGASLAAPPAATPSPPAPHDDELPDQDALNKAFGVTANAPGTFQINADAHGVYRDPQGAPYMQDPFDGELLTDPAGKQYRVQHGVATPAPNATTDKGQVVRGAGDAFAGGSQQVLDVALPNAANPLGVAADTGDTISRLLRAAFGSRDTGEQISAGLQHAPENAMPNAFSGLPIIGVQPATVSGRLQRALGAGLVGAVVPETEGPTALSAVRNAFTGSGGALTGQLASEVAPEPFKPAANAFGGLVGGIATHGGMSGAGSAFRGGWRTVEPFAAAASPRETGAAGRQAGVRLSELTTDPQAARTAIHDAGTGELVPGSQPTTFQLTGDLGIGSAERGAIRTPEGRPQFVQRAAEQNQARVDALGGIQSGADPAALGSALADELDRIGQRTQSTLDAATQAAQTRTGAIGGTTPPTEAGAALRGSITDSEAASKAAYRRLYDAVDPDGKLTANVVATKTAARDIPAGQPATAAPITGEEAAIYQATQGMPDVAPARDLMALKVRVNDAASTELRQNGHTAIYARLTQFGNALKDNISRTISDKVSSDDAAVQSGQMPAALSARAQAAAWIAEANARGQRIRLAGDGAGATSGGGTPADAGAGGTALPPGGQLPGASGNPQGAPAPTFDEGAASRQVAADQAYAEHAQTFGVNPVSGVLKTNGYRGQFTMPDGSVPGQFFKPGAAGFDLMQRALKAGGPQAQGILEDFAASTLRREAMTPEGVIDPGKFRAWQTKYADALSALPDATRARFADAASAGQAVAEAAGAREAALKAYQSGAVGKILKLADPTDSDAVTKAIGTILRGPNAAADFRSLAGRVRNNPAARDGLRQAVADHIANNLISNTEVGTSGQGGIRADQFQTFVRNNRSALGQVFSPDEVSRFEALAADIQRAKRSDNALQLQGSNTTPDAPLMMRMLQRGTRGSLDALAAVLGFHAMGAEGSAIGALGTDYMQQLRNAGIRNVNDLVIKGLLDPQVYLRLTSKVPINPGARQTFLQGLLRDVTRGAYVGAAASNANASAQTRRSVFGQPVPVRPPVHAFPGAAP